MHPRGYADGGNHKNEDPALRSESRVEWIAEQKDDHEQKREQRQCEKEIRKAHERTVQRFEVTSQNPDQGTQNQRNQHRSHAHGHRNLSSRHHAGQNVTSQLIRAKWVIKAGSLIAGPDIDEGCINIIKPRSQKRGENNSEEYDCPGHSPLVAAELAPDIRPVATADVSCLVR